MLAAFQFQKHFHLQTKAQHKEAKAGGSGAAKRLKAKQGFASSLFIGYTSALSAPSAPEAQQEWGCDWWDPPNYNLHLTVRIWIWKEYRATKGKGGTQRQQDLKMVHLKLWSQWTNTKPDKGFCITQLLFFFEKVSLESY